MGGGPSVPPQLTGLPSRWADGGPLKPGRMRPNTSCPVPIKVCPRRPLETRTRTSSSCSSYSRGGWEWGLAQPPSLRVLRPVAPRARFLATEHQEPGLMGDGMPTKSDPRLNVSSLTEPTQRRIRIVLEQTVSRVLQGQGPGGREPA